MKRINKLFPALLIFILVNVIVFAMKDFLSRNNVDTGFVLITNLLLFVLVAFSMLLQLGSLHSANNHAFIRGVYTSMMIRMFICMVAIFIYIYSKSGNVNKPGLFTGMGLYILYTAVEVNGLMKAVRNNNA